MAQNTLILAIDSGTFLPGLPMMMKLHNRNRKRHQEEPHNGVGPGGVMDSVIYLTMNLNEQLVARPNAVPRVNPNLLNVKTRLGGLMLETSLGLLKAVPPGVTEILPVNMNGFHAKFLLTYNGDTWKQPEFVHKLKPESFLSQTE